MNIGPNEIGEIVASVWATMLGGELFALLTLAVTFVVATVILATPIDGGPGVYLNSVEVPKLGRTPSSSLSASFGFVPINASSASLKPSPSASGGTVTSSRSCVGP